MRRFYIPPDQMGKDESIIMGDDARHMRVVLKMQPNDLIVVFDGSGRQFQARIVSFAREQVKVAMLKPLASNAEPPLELAIAQGYLKDKKMDGLVRQLTELGVARWVPFLSRRSVPVPDPQRLQARFQRWEKISLASLKQCGRNRTMTIAPVIPFGEALVQAATYDVKIIFWELSKDASLVHQELPSRPTSVFMMVGPEGGFDKEEIALAKQAGFGVNGMGPRTLKADTATIVAAAMAQFVFGDMSLSAGTIS